MYYKFIRLSVLIASYTICSFITGCNTLQHTEMERFEASVKKDLPFNIDSLRWIEVADITAFRFVIPENNKFGPDLEIDRDGRVTVSKTFIYELSPHLDQSSFWRNIVVSKRHRRVICVDRFIKDNLLQGYVYVLQSEDKKYPTYGTYHWNVSDSHNIEVVGSILSELRQKTFNKWKDINNDSF